MTYGRSSRRKIAIISVGRSDYGLYRPLLRAIGSEPALALDLIVGGAHLSPKFGSTLSEIIDDGITPAAKVECTLSNDTPGSIALSIGRAVKGFATAFDTLRPDIAVVLGDRYEMHAATIAAVPFLFPIAHIAGGAITRGAIDDALRHSITKLCHLHFPETTEQAARITRLGEEEWRIHAVGSLSIDNLRSTALLSREAFNVRFSLALADAPLLVTLHPVTREFMRTQEYVESLLTVLEAQPYPLLFTYPNADTAGQIIIDRIAAFVRQHADRAFVVPHLGTQGHFSAMALARAMIGNSSSGIIEAASFKLPVINIGRRQEGRLPPANVISCDHDANSILAALARALDPAFRAGLSGLVNPYGDGSAAARIVDVLTAIAIDDRLLVKATF